MASVYMIWTDSLNLWRFLAVSVLLVTALAAGQFAYNLYFHPLAGIPGPTLYGGSNIPKMIHQLRGNIHNKTLELHEKYGPVVRLAPNELSYTSASAVREIYGNRGGKTPMPPQTSLGKHDSKMFGATSLLWLESHAEHARHRKILSTAFNETSLKAQEPIVLGYEALLTKNLRACASRGEVVDMWAWLNFLTFDVIGDLTFGESFDCVRDGAFHPWIAFIFSNLTNMMYAQMLSTLGTLSALVEPLVPAHIWAEAMSHAQATRTKVDCRLVRQTHRPDFVTSMERHIDRPGGMSSAELYADSNILIMAGSETTATLLAVAIYYLLRNPSTLDRLRDEVRAAFPTGEEEITFAAVGSGRLPYLLAVVHEALRIHPPLPAGINRTVPEGGAVVDGRYLAAGTVLQVAHWPAFHLEANFADPWEFVPERFLPGGEGGRPARYDADNRDVFQPFSFGQRNCIGRSLAYVEAKTTLARLVLAFDMELMPESRDWNKQRVYLLYEKRPLYVKLTEAKKEKCEM